MEVVSADEARQAAFKKLLGVETPYALHRDLREDAPGAYVIVYEPPLNPRKIVAVEGIMKKRNGRYLLGLLEIAWAEGVVFGRVKTEG